MPKQLMTIECQPTDIPKKEQGDRALLPFGKVFREFSLPQLILNLDQDAGRILVVCGVVIPAGQRESIFLEKDAQGWRPNPNNRAQAECAFEANAPESNGVQ
jgi:hypothetical protein